MPRSKRAKAVALTKTSKQPKAAKGEFIKKVLWGERIEVLHVLNCLSRATVGAGLL